MFGLIAYRESTWFDRQTDFRQWDHLARAYGAEMTLLEQTESPDPKRTLIVVDETGETSLQDFEHPQECDYLFGRTGLNDLPSVYPFARSIHIETLVAISLFGVCAASIVLEDRKRKR